MGTRTARINWLRGALREVGVSIPVGARRGIGAVRQALAAPQPALPGVLCRFIEETLAEIAELEQRGARIERELASLTHDDAVVRGLLAIPGIGPLSATALAATIVDIQRFPSGRHLASWLGLTAREHSSGERRRLGRPLDRLRAWALATAQRCGYNKATVALANKLARIVWATWKYQ
ncbi:MAG: transposase, partial [Steroidobacteraceae bacterium]